MLSYAFIDTLSHLPFIEKIILFGSRARKDNIERSDIDLAIVCPKATSDNWMTVLEIIENADTLLKIDCIRFDTLSEASKIKTNIINEGIILYEQSIH